MLEASSLHVFLSLQVEILLLSTVFTNIGGISTSFILILEVLPLVQMLVGTKLLAAS